MCVDPKEQGKGYGSLVLDSLIQQAKDAGYRKIGLSVWLGLMLLGVSYKVVYDIGYFDARSLDDTKISLTPIENQKLTLAVAQQVVTGALKEDSGNPATVVVQIVDDNARLSTIIIENNKQRSIGWIINMELFFVADI